MGWDDNKLLCAHPLEWHCYAAVNSNIVIDAMSSNILLTTEVQ